MDYVIDKYTGLLVEATQALPLRKHYVCPICRADCHLRKGLKQRPHFAHDSGAAPDDCENYHPGESHSRGFQNAYWSLHRRSPKLYVCESDAIDGNSPTWNLMLLIPECQHGIGSIEITQGQYGTVTIPVAHLTQGGQRVYVRPQVTYQIGVNGQIDHVYQQIITRPIPGLNKQRCNVFRYSPTGGRIFHDNQVLFWGLSYYLVWHRNCEPGWWPRSEGLWCRNLNHNGEWHCAIIELPAEEDYQVRKWAENILCRGVEKPPVTLSLVAPIVIRRLEDESLLIPAADEVILSVTGELGAIIPSELCLQLPTNGTSMVVKLHGPLPIIVSIGQLPPGRTEIWLPDNPDISLSFCAVKLEQGYHPQGVRFVFEETLHQSQVFAPVHSLLTRSLMAEVRQGHASLVMVTIPRRVSTTIRVRGQFDTRWQELHLAVEYVDDEKINALKHKEFEEHVQQEIIAKLIKCQGKLEIDFENYGKVNLNLSRDGKSETCALRSHWRRQLGWILYLLQARNIRGKFSSGEGIKQLQRYLEQIPIDQFVPEDRLLINLLLKYDYVPVAAEVHLREIVKRIRGALIETDISF